MHHRDTIKVQIDVVTVFSCSHMMCGFHAPNWILINSDLLIQAWLSTWRQWHIKPTNIDFPPPNASRCPCHCIFHEVKNIKLNFNTKQFSVVQASCRAQTAPVKLLQFPFVEDFRWHRLTFPGIIFVKQSRKENCHQEEHERSSS